MNSIPPAASGRTAPASRTVRSVPPSLVGISRVSFWERDTLGHGRNIGARVGESESAACPAPQLELILLEL
jgi:hypothetical protein